MNLEYAVNRLYETGWRPATSSGSDLQPLPNGRYHPSLFTIQREFARAGLELSIKHNLIFNCYRATWHPVGEPLDQNAEADERHGTVVGTCEKEAAVYALAQLRIAQAERQLVTA
jgi:hypothetical protein